MIDKYELLKRLNKMDRLILQRPELSEYAKEIHCSYINFFREQIYSMEEKRFNYNEMALGIVIGAVAEAAVIVLCSKLF